MWNRKTSRFWLLAMVAMVALLAACSGGDVSQEDYDAAMADRDTAQASLSTSQGQVSQLQAQLASMAPGSLIQTGQLVPAPAGSAPTGWANEESVRGGLTLMAQYDSSGPDAWDVAAHPLVYITSESASNPNRDREAPYFAGFQLIDAYSKEVMMC